MRQQMTHRDRRQWRRRIREELRHRVLEPELPLFDEEHDRCGRELLSERSGLEDGLWSDGDLMFDVGESVPFRREDGALLHDGDRDARHFLSRHLGAHKRVDPVQVERLATGGKRHTEQRGDKAHAQRPLN